MKDISGFVEISDEGIKKHFKNFEVWQPVFELIWNGLDADADSVKVLIKDNELGVVNFVSVEDNGEGIDPDTLSSTFGRFYESQKNQDVASHGAHGRGRLAFHLICNNASWFSKSKNGNIHIEISGKALKKFNANIIEDVHQHNELRKSSSGTIVELSGFFKNLPTISEIRKKISDEFGWFFAANQNRKIYLNDVEIKVPLHEIYNEEIYISDYLFDVKIIHWKDRRTSEKSFIYLLDDTKRVIHKELSKFNKKPGFFVSIYVISSWANKFGVEQDLLFPDAHTVSSVEWRNLLKNINFSVEKIYKEFLRTNAEIEVKKYEEEGLLPNYHGLEVEERNWRLNNVKELVKSIYVADPTIFNSSGKKQKKIIIRLLDKLSISSENESLFDVLNGVLDMDDKTIDILANQLKRTTFENIVSTIERLQKRQDVVHKLREIMNNHYKDILETPDLQKIIEANTWLFGNKYETIGAEEDNFVKIVKNLKEKIPFELEESDLDPEDLNEIEGARKQVDLFLARKIPTVDSYGKKIYRCIIIEIKRPSIALNVKHLRQLDDYAGIISRYPEFTSECMHFELILIGRKISSSDIEIASRLRSQLNRGELGLVSDDPRMKRYILNWYTLLDGFELSHSSMLELLKLKRLNLEDESKDGLLVDLQS